MSQSQQDKSVVDFERAEVFILSKLQKELSPNLFYHNLDHTRDVLQAAVRIAGFEHISEDQIKLLRIAVLYHDAGFIYVYKNHEEKGCEMVREYLPAFGISKQQADTICGLILATRYPQRPSSQLQQIIADADLDYLGREDVHTIARKLYDELKAYHKINGKQEWNAHQINMLKSHSYHTSFSREHREPNKQKYLDELIQKQQKP